MKLVVWCTDCGKPRKLDGIDTNELPIDNLTLITHSCDCNKKCEGCLEVKKCEDCEDMEFLRKKITEISKLRSDNRRLALQLRGMILYNG